jgi:ribonuclease-3
MGLKKISLYNKNDHALKISQIFGNTLEALIGAVFLDKGYNKTQKWVENYIILPHLFINELENIEINIKSNIFVKKPGKSITK